MGPEQANNNDFPSEESFLYEPEDSGKRLKNITESESDTNNYNSRKYIEYLDSDVYPEHSS